MSKIAIYYFSATGNSLAVARLLAQALDIDDPVSVPGSLINEDPYAEARGAKALGFVFPVQRATLPEMLRGFIQLMPIDPNCYYFAVSTYSLFGSNEFWDIDELLVSKGAALNYAAGIRMMGNVGLMNPSEATIQKRLEHMNSQIDAIATAVAYRQENFFPRSNKFLAWAVRNYTDVRRKHIFFRIDQRCKGCGICVQVCPAQNIKLVQMDAETVAPIRSDKCEACLACVHWCPAAAVSASGRRRHTNYHNPLILPEELNAKLPKPSLNVLTGDALVPPESAYDVMSSQELAAALRDDLLTPADIDAWLSRTGDGQMAAPVYPRSSGSGVGSASSGGVPGGAGYADIPVGSDQSVSPDSPPAPGMSDAEIVKALSDLEK